MEDTKAMKNDMRMKITYNEKDKGNKIRIITGNVRGSNGEEI